MPSRIVAKLSWLKCTVSENDFPTGDVGGDGEKRGRNSSANLTLEQFAQL